MVRSMVDRIQSFLELKIFGVCAWLGVKLGIKSSRIRLYFIYLSFFTLGSPVILYLFMAFLLEHKEFLKPGRGKGYRRIWDL